MLYERDGEFIMVMRGRSGATTNYNIYFLIYMLVALRMVAICEEMVG